MRNQIVIITGGARGIGFGIGECFARQGASIAIPDLNAEAARDAAVRLNAQGAVDSIGITCDVADRTQVDYGASKGGLRMLMVGFATRLGRHGITCNAIAPGMILTEMTRWHWEQPGPAEEIKKRVPVGRIGTPEDIGHAAVFLASQEASYINGISLRVDGGHQALCV
ncbi:MAG: SDR family oxidoreductase [Candidatus Hydrogenedentes bacterium]|nr:SDR family oxidoreductase [Candidatus Hydrogenedentota bacterium]